MLLAGAIALGALAAVLASKSLGAAKPQPATVIKFATLAPDKSTWMNVMHDLDDEIRAETGNRVGFKFYHSGVQGDEMEVLRKIRNGQLHAGGFTGFGLGAVASDFRALEVPFMYRDLGEVDHARATLAPHFVDLFKQKGFSLLGWADVGFVYLYSHEPIRSPADLKRAKIWTWSGDKLAALFFKAFHVSPIPLALPDVLTSLQVGVVNAVYAPPLACVALQWHTRVKYMTDVPITYGFGAMLMSNDIVKKIGPQDMAVISRLAEKHSSYLIARTREQNDEAITGMSKQGVTILEVDPKVSEEFFTTGRGAWKEGVGELYPAELLDRVIKSVEEYRKNPNASTP
jgi:TRAP-type C4-dicarboxylate transport system substrate-binding protein